MFPFFSLSPQCNFTMGRCWLCLLLASFCAGLGRKVSWADGVNPTNITVKPAVRSLEVFWNAPVQNLFLDSYRVRVYPTTNEKRKQVQWVPLTGALRETISCLEPATHYRVQVIARHLQNSNLTDGSSEVVGVSTLHEVRQGILDQVWEHRVFVMVGAILMAVLFIFLTPCIWCCCQARRRKQWSLESVDDKTEKKRKKQKTKTLPSATELQERERNMNESRYCKDPVQGMGSRMNSTTSQNALLIQTPPPSYNRAYQHTRSIPADHAPERGIMPPPDTPDFTSDSEPDHADYQNKVFGPGCSGEDSELYENQVFFPRHPPEPEPLYGNLPY